MATIPTQRLLLRRFRPEDWADLYDYLSLPEVVRFEPYDVFTADEAKHEAARRSDDPAFWAVVLLGAPAIGTSSHAVAPDGTVIGNLWLSQGDSDTWELGYVFHSHYWGHGYATEACRAVMDHAFGAAKAHRVVAMVNPENEPSWRLLGRLGFRREGHLRQNIFFQRSADGEPLWQDTYEYGLLASEWSVPDGVQR